MTLVLALIFSATIVGAMSRRFGRRERAAGLGLALLVTAGYLVFAARFM